jgi:hypothetical protein
LNFFFFIHVSDLTKLKDEYDTLEGELRTLRDTYNSRQDTWIKEKLESQVRNQFLFIAGTSLLPLLQPSNIIANNLLILIPIENEGKNQGAGGADSEAEQLILGVRADEAS